MVTTLLIFLIALDIALLIAVYRISKQRINPLEIIEELTEERRLVSEMRDVVKEELAAGQVKCRDVLDRISTLATEIDEEFKSSRKILTSEMEQVLQELAKRIDVPIQQVTKKQAVIENLLKKVDFHKTTLAKAIDRGEKIVKFFNQKIPYEEILEELEDKKYLDARQLLSKGVPVYQVAKELNIPESEVALLVSVG